MDEKGEEEDDMVERMEGAESRAESRGKKRGGKKTGAHPAQNQLTLMEAGPCRLAFDIARRMAGAESRGNKRGGENSGSDPAQHRLIWAPISASLLTNTQCS